MEWTHAIVTGAGVVVELAYPESMTMTVPTGCSAIAKSQIETWMASYGGNLNGVCAHFGWTNSTGENPDDGN